MGNKPSLEDVIFDIKLKSKEMTKTAARCEKEMKSEKNKVKVAIEKGNIDGARVFAQNAIRKKHEVLNYHKLSSKLDAVASRLDAAHRSQTMTKDICKAVPNLQKILNELNIDDLTANMDQFEKLFDDIDVRSDYMTNSIDQTTASSTPADQVDSLIAQVAEEHALDVSQMLTCAPSTTPERPSIAAAVPFSLQQRLDNLKLWGLYLIAHT